MRAHNNMQDSIAASAGHGPCWTLTADASLSNIATPKNISQRSTMPEIDDPAPDDIKANIIKLRDRLDVIPHKWLDHNLIIGSWNIRAFGDLTKEWHSKEGDSPKRDLEAVLYIKEIISRFDVVAVQEVRGNIRALRYLLKALGEHWGFILTDVTAGKAGNDERMAYLYDTRRVKPSGLAGELVIPEEWLKP